MKDFRQLWAASLLSVAVCLPAAADQKDPRLDLLFEKLKGAETFAISHRTVQEIWIIWHEWSGDAAVNEAMGRGLRAMRESSYGDALDAFNKAADLAPEFAEAWNKRATIEFLMGDYEASIADIQRTLALEPRHFGALAGLGQINLALDRKEAALKAFDEALKINPFLAERFQIEALRKELEGEKI